MKRTLATLFVLSNCLAFFACSSRQNGNPVGSGSRSDGTSRFTTGLDGKKRLQGDCQTKNNCPPIQLMANIEGNHQVAQDGRQKFWLGEVNRQVNWPISFSIPDGRPLLVFTNLAGANMQQQPNSNTWQVNWVPKNAEQKDIEIYARDLKRCQLSAADSTNCNSTKYNPSYDFKARIAYFIQKLNDTSDKKGNPVCSIAAVGGAVSNNIISNMNPNIGGLIGSFVEGFAKSGTCDELRNYAVKPRPADSATPSKNSPSTIATKGLSSNWMQGFSLPADFGATKAYWSDTNTFTTGFDPTFNDGKPLYDIDPSILQSSDIDYSKAFTNPVTSSYNTFDYSSSVYETNTKFSISEPSEP